jgi:hypothetical protein
MKIYEVAPKIKSGRLPTFGLKVVPRGVEIMNLIEAEPSKATDITSGLTPLKRSKGMPVTMDICRNVVTMFEQGMSQDKIQKILNIGSTTCLIIINGFKEYKSQTSGPILRQMPPAKEPTYDDYRKTLEARKRGASYWDIVTTLGVTARACDWYLNLTPEEIDNLKLELKSQEKMSAEPPPPPIIIEAPQEPEPPAGRLRALCGRLLRFLRGQSRRG